MNDAVDTSDRSQRPAGDQVVELADGRALVRHRAGISLLSRAEVNARGDPERQSPSHTMTVEPPAGQGPHAGRRGQGGTGRDAVEGTGRSLRGAESTGGPPGEPPGGQVLGVLGSGPAATWLGDALAGSPRLCARVERWPEPPETAAGGAAGGAAGDRLALCVLEESTYADGLNLQRSLLAAGLPALFVTFDPDALRLAVVVPGAGPCFGCQQLAGLRFLGGPVGELLEVAGRFTSGRCPEERLPALGQIVARELAALTARPERSSLVGHLLLLPPNGPPRRVPLARAADCPLCTGLATPEDSGPLLARLAHCTDTELAAAIECAPSLLEPLYHSHPSAREVSEPGSQRPTPEVAPVAKAERHLAATGRDGWVRRVGIVGGGTAGYLAALALRRYQPQLDVTLIESPAVPVIGVGEATTPLMPQFLHADLGLEAAELFSEVRPTFKLGIRFLWGLPGEGDFNYPFGPVRPLEAACYDGHLRHCSLRSMAMGAGTVPVERGEPGPGDMAEEEAGVPLPRFDTELAYHLDNRRFVAYLKRRAERRGVERLEATIEAVETCADRRRVTALTTGDGRRLAFDLYVDASGFRSLLLGGALEAPFLPFADSLPTDRAVVAQVPHRGTVAPYTLAETMSAGWCWSTPQQETDHRGYVFCSAFQSPEQAEAEMRRANPGMGEARLLTFRAGRRAWTWRGNVFALGNAYGFVEPLESTALHLLIRQLGLLVRAFPLRCGEDGRAGLLNRRVGDWWDYLRWFLALHYRFNRRLDTPFWRWCAQEVDLSSHGELLEAFRDRGPLSYDPLMVGSFPYPDPLWGPEGIDLLLLGQGVDGGRPEPALSREAWRQQVERCRRIVARQLAQADALAAIARHPPLAAALGKAFRRRGPAFGGAPARPSPRPPAPPA